MATVRIDALIAKYRRALAASSTDAAFAVRVPQIATPSFDFDLGPQSVGNAAVMFQPFANANNATFSVRIIGWRFLESGTGVGLWIPAELYEADCVCGNIPGVSGYALTNAEFLADTITLVTGNNNVSSETVSPANDQPAHFVVDMKGFRYLETLFKTGTATTMNALLAPF